MRGSITVMTRSWSSLHSFSLMKFTTVNPTRPNPFLMFFDVRNQDFREVTLECEGEVVLRFAIANGFRNIQNVVQKLKRNKCPYHFVEIMACPSGKALQECPGRSLTLPVLICVQGP